MTQQQRAAIEAVARHFSTTWRGGGYLSVAGQRIAFELTTLKARPLEKPRLRFDKVATGFIRRLQEGLAETTPNGKTVVVTITAPIRQDSKTGAALQDKIRALIARRSVQPRLAGAIHGNRLEVRLIKHSWSRASKLIGFVHNPDSDPVALFAMTRSLLECRPAAWLVIDCEAGFPLIDTYRQVYAQLFPQPPFKQVLMVLAGGRVEELTP